MECDTAIKTIRTHIELHTRMLMEARTAKQRNTAIKEITKAQRDLQRLILWCAIPLDYPGLNIENKAVLPREPQETPEPDPSQPTLVEKLLNEHQETVNQPQGPKNQEVS